jgi:hypothetical protein
MSVGYGTKALETHESIFAYPLQGSIGRRRVAFH